MCHYCDEFGDPEIGGGLWYLNPTGYARNMYKLRNPGQGYQGPEADLEFGEVAEIGTNDLINALEEGNWAEFDRMRHAMQKRNENRGYEGQCVPLKDAEKVLELSSPIGLMSCVCRKGVRGIDERNEHEYTCMGMGVGMLKWERWPERYKGGVKFVTAEEGKEWLRKMDAMGYVHFLMMWGVPYIGGFCQCDYPDCGYIRDSNDFGVIGALKSHYVASVDYDLCNGCKLCAHRCKYGALKFEHTVEAPNIDQFKCFGCGLCETSCPREAIKLLERKSLPALAEVWL